MRLTITKAEQLLQKLHANPFFEWTTVIIILVSSLTIGVKTYNLSDTALSAIQFLDWLITIYFLVEIIIRIIAAGGIRPFFAAGGWNIFDFIIVAVSLIPVDESQHALLARILRLFRVMRVIYFVPELRHLILALISSIPRIGYVALMMFIIFYIYGVIGNVLFEKINPVLWGDVGISMLTLFRVATFEDWTDVMYETMAVYPFSWLFYLSFIFFASFVFLNMMIGVIIESMSETQQQKDDDGHKAELAQINQRLADISAQLKQKQ